MSLLDDVSIVVTPNGYKAGELYAVIPVPTLGAELGDTGTTDDNAGGVITQTSPLNYNATSDGTSTSVTRPRINNFTVTVGKRYRITITPSNQSGTIQFSINNDGTYLAQDNDLSSNLEFDFTNGSNLRMFFDGTETFNCDFIISLKELTSADMDVTRATAATRVDEDGLVNYAEILGSELITNGDFSTSGTPTDTSYTLGWRCPYDSVDNVTIDNGVATILNPIGSGGKFFATNGVDSSNVVESGKLYKLTYEVVENIGNTTFRYHTGSAYVTGNNTVGSHTIYYQANGTIFLFRNLTTGSTIKLGNVSIKEVTRDNVPRIDYTGGGCPHILAEPARTNLIKYSEDFSDSSWNQITATVTATTNTNPSGESGTYSVENVSGTQLGASFSITSGNDYTVSWYVRNISGTGAVIIKDTNFTTNNFTATSEWQRFSVTATASSTIGRCYLQVPTTNDEVEVWGAQFEEGSYATSYIPNFGTSSGVTRAQDVFTRDGIGSLINDSEGVLFAEIAALPNDTSGRWLSLSNGTVNERLSFGFQSSNIRLYIKNTSGLIWDYTTSGIDILNDNKIALKYKSGDYALWINGTEVSTSTNSNLPSGLISLQFSAGVGGGSGNFYGKVKQLQVYDTALTDDELELLTGATSYGSFGELAEADGYTII